MPELSISRGRALATGAAVLAALYVLGRLFLGGDAAAGPAAEAEVSIRRAPAARVVVHVVGAVRSPGLYRLRHGARVADAVARAGGATAGADVALVNLAAPLADGQQVVVPAKARVEAAGDDRGGEPSSAPGGPVHLNTATLADLDGLPGVGPVTAQKILDYREQHGAFSSVDQLDDIPGIGPARLEQLRELVAP